MGRRWKRRKGERNTMMVLAFGESMEEEEGAW